MPKDRPRSPTADRRALANALRELRESAGLSLEQAAATALEASAAKLSRIETGKQVVGARDVRDLCTLYGISATRTDELMTWAASARKPAWWESYSIDDDDYVGLESAATHIREFQTSFVPSLLQTRDYAEAYLNSVIADGRSQPWGDAEIRDWLEIHERRKHVLETSSGVQLFFVIDEAALLRAVGGADAMRAEIQHLIEISGQTNVHLRVLPLIAGASPGQMGGFSLLTMPNGPDVAYVESQGGLSLIEDSEQVDRFRRVFDFIHQSSPDEDHTADALEFALTQLP